MNQGRDLTATKETITDAAVRECNCRSIPAGTVVMSFKLSIGKVGVTTHDMFTNEAIAAVRIKRPNEFNTGYLYHALRSLDFDGIGETAVKGVTLNLGSLTSLKIPAPPYDVQQRIAQVLDKADAIRRRRRESLRLLDEFLRSAFLEMFGDPVRNEKGWNVKPLGELADFVGGGTPSRAVSAYFTGQVCWATAKDIQSENVIDTQEHITSEAIQNSATKVVRPGTILIVVKSKVLMHRLPVAIAQVPTCFGQDLKGIVLRSGLSPTYVARHLRLGQSWFLNRARGANTEGLTLDHLRRFPVMLPPSDLIERYDQVERKYRETNKAFATHIEHSDALFDSLAQRAFRGEL